MTPKQIKIACVLITHLIAKAESRRRPALRGKPFIIVCPSQTAGNAGQVVLDSSPEAKGVVEGMTATEASSRCKDIILVQADESYYRKILDSITIALSQITISVEKPLNTRDRLYVTLGNLERMYGGDARAAAMLLRTVPYDLKARVGIADGKFPAYVAAFLSEPGRASRAPADVMSFLRRVSVDLLPIEREYKVRLNGFGLYTLGDVASIELSALQAQFGLTGRVIWELANGIDRTPVVPYSRDEEEEMVIEDLTFSSPATTINSLLAGTNLLLGRAFSRPTIRGRHVRAASLHGRVIGRSIWKKNFAFKNAVNGRDRAFDIMKSALDGIVIPGALEDLSLTLYGLTSESGRQPSLLWNVRRQDQLRETMHQLTQRLRTKPPVYQVREVEPWSRIPERRQVLIHFDP